MTFLPNEFHWEGKNNAVMSEEVVRLKHPFKADVHKNVEHQIPR